MAFQVKDLMVPLAPSHLACGPATIGGQCPMMTNPLLLTCPGQSQNTNCLPGTGVPGDFTVPDDGIGLLREQLSVALEQARLN